MIYINQALRQHFTTGIDTSGVTDISLFYKKPDGTEGEISTGIEIETPADGKYYVDFATDFLDVEGRWTFWSYVIDDEGNEFPGAPFQLDVLPIGTAQYPVSVDYIKQFLGITDTTQDFKISAMIPILIDQYLKIRNAPWQLDASGTIIFPQGLETTIAMMYDYINKNDQYKDVISERIGSYSVAYSDKVIAGYPSTITSQIVKYIRGA